MARKLLLTFCALGIAVSVSAAETFKVRLLRDSTIGGESFQAGQCKVMLVDGIATITQGSQTVRIPAREQSDGMKFSSTALTYRHDTLMEIGLGGTHTKIIFGNSDAAKPGA